MYAQFFPSGLNDTAMGGLRKARLQLRLPVWRSAVPTKVEYQNAIFVPEMNRPPLAPLRTQACVGCSGSTTSRTLKLESADPLLAMRTSGSTGTGSVLQENFGSGTGAVGESIGLGDAEASALGPAEAAALGVGAVAIGGAPQAAIARTAIATPTSDVTERA
jgi:hypothetical protein